VSIDDLCVKSVPLEEDQMKNPEKTIVGPGSWVKRAGFRQNGSPVKSNEEIVEPQIFSRFALLLDSPRDSGVINHVRAAPPETEVV
jgi:hypothetical protein